MQWSILKNLFFISSILQLSMRGAHNIVHDVLYFNLNSLLSRAWTHSELNLGLLLQRSKLHRFSVDPPLPSNNIPTTNIVLKFCFQENLIRFSVATLQNRGESFFIFIFFFLNMNLILIITVNINIS